MRPSPCMSAWIQQSGFGDQSDLRKYPFSAMPTLKWIECVQDKIHGAGNYPEKTPALDHPNKHFVVDLGKASWMVFG